MQNYHDSAIKVVNQHFIQNMSPPADLLQLLFCHKSATSMLICCPIRNKMVLSVVSACLIADYTGQQKHFLY